MNAWSLDDSLAFQTKLDQLREAMRPETPTERAIQIIHAVAAECGKLGEVEVIDDYTPPEGMRGTCYAVQADDYGLVIRTALRLGLRGSMLDSAGARGWIVYWPGVGGAE